MRFLFTMLTALVVQACLHAQALQKIDNLCSPEDAEALGLTCSEDDPCPVFLELSSVEGFGASIFVTGNLHTVDTTIYGVLLASDDAGKTWTEPARRIRSAALEQLQFIDGQHGWASGMLLDPLPRAPFVLSTENGGQVWRRTELSDDPDFGSIQQLWFDSASRGQLVVDRSQGKSERYELYVTANGGESWTFKASSGEPMRLPNVKPPEKANWRAVADPAAEQENSNQPASYRVERRTATGWETLARFAIRAGECK